MKKIFKNFLILAGLTIVTSVIGKLLADNYGWQTAIYSSGWIGGSLYASFKL